MTNPAVTAAQDPAAAGADEAGSWQPEVLNIRECLHHAPRPKVQHLTILSLGTDGICNMQYVESTLSITSDHQVYDDGIKTVAIPCKYDVIRLHQVSGFSNYDDVITHLERAGGVQSVHQQSPPPRVRGQATHRPTVTPVNLQRSNSENVTFYFTF